MRMKALLLLAALALAGAAADAQAVENDCTIYVGAQWVSVSLIDQPFAYQDLEPELTPAQIALLPSLPDPDDDTVRREHVYISTTLADLIGLYPYDRSGDFTVNADWTGPNPQIRVWIEDPETFRNYYKEDASSNHLYRYRASSAVFTVVGVVQHHLERIWVYDQETSTDRHSGEYKLFAWDTVNSSDQRIRRARQFADANGNGWLDDIWARVFITPVSSSTQTRGGVTTTDPGYCEPDTWDDGDGDPDDDVWGSFTENAIHADDDRFALLVPHGGAIETGTSDQIAPVREVLEAEEPYDVPVNLWELRGTWGDEQTHTRWHATATNLSESGFPGLRMMLDQDPYDSAAEKAFRYALALHGFDPGNGEAELILGGQASRDAKCLVAQRIQDRLATAGRSRQAIAMVIRDDDEDDIEIADASGHTVATTDHQGLSESNIVNRLAADGGVQLEQSKALRDDEVLLDAVARGAAAALGELVTDHAPADPCEPFLPEEAGAAAAPEAAGGPGIPTTACFQFHYPPARETFVIQLTDAAKIHHARGLLAGSKDPKQRVSGTVVKAPASYNLPWSYHLEPDSIEFFEYAVEVCDAGIQYVEDHLGEVGGAFLPGNFWCPWGSTLTKEVACER